MKKLASFLGLLFFLPAVNAQLKTTTDCASINVEILDGKVNDFTPKSTVNQIKLKLPCFSSAEVESDSARCGGIIFFKDKDIYFYTGRDYIEIGPHFKGKLSLPIMGAARNSLFKWLGNPLIKDANWDAFQMAYGIMIIYYDKASKVNKIQMSTESASTIKLCE